MANRIAQIENKYNIHMRIYQGSMHFCEYFRPGNQTVILSYEIEMSTRPMHFYNKFKHLLIVAVMEIIRESRFETTQLRRYEVNKLRNCVSIYFHIPKSACAERKTYKSETENS